MRMYRPILITAACLCIGLTPVSASAPQSQKSETIVYIGGEKFYIHTVQPGQTLYSIARLYGVSEQTLVAYNPTMADVLKADQNVKIPVPAPQMQPDEAPLTARQEKKLRKKFILHTVEAHETLYAISKRYGISVETLLEDNENLDPTHLSDRRHAAGTEKGGGQDQQRRESRRIGRVQGEAEQRSDRRFPLLRRPTGRYDVFARPRQPDYGANALGTQRRPFVRNAQSRCDHQVADGRCTRHRRATGRHADGAAARRKTPDARAGRRAPLVAAAARHDRRAPQCQAYRALSGIPAGRRPAPPRRPVGTARRFRHGARSREGRDTRRRQRSRPLATRSSAPCTKTNWHPSCASPSRRVFRSFHRWRRSTIRTATSSSKWRPIPPGNTRNSPGRSTAAAGSY